MKQIVLELENLDCEGCANSIRRALLRQPGILSVHIDVKAGRVDLSCEDDFDRSHLVGILDVLGYPLLGRNSMMCMARAKLSCELGKIRHQTYYNPMLGWRFDWVKVKLIQLKVPLNHGIRGASW